MNSKIIYNIIKEIEKLSIFFLCKQFDDLSLDDVGSSSNSSNVGSSGGNINSFLRSRIHSLWSTSINEQLRAPFIELPRNIINELSLQSYEISMGLGFRFLPGQTDFLGYDLTLPKSFDRLSFIWNNLGLSSSCSIGVNSLLSYSYGGSGLRGLVNNGMKGLLVEVITYTSGMYGRFLVLVSLGIGCTVWYGLVPGSEHCAPIGGVFTPIESYDPFFNMDYVAPGFRKISFLEKKDVCESVVSAFENEVPFAEIQIPRGGAIFTVVGLGVMVAFFLSVGLVPNVSGYTVS